jgi:SAM-dependent methyltransferase
VCAAKDAAFRACARSLDLDPDNQWIGGYASHQWEHGRHILEAHVPSLAGREALEFGCNVGASAIVMAALGVRVTALEVSADLLALARLNAARYGVEAAIKFVHVEDTSALPFADARFDVIACFSTLEYVQQAILARVQTELARVLRPGGYLLVSGTSNRLWPREVHSGRWLTNYLPVRLDGLILGGDQQRGVFPWQVRYGFGAGFRNLDWDDGCARFLDARQRMGASETRLRGLRMAARIARAFGVSVGLLAPSISLSLRKDGWDVPVRGMSFPRERGSMGLPDPRLRENEGIEDVHQLDRP